RILVAAADKRSPVRCAAASGGRQRSDGHLRRQRQGAAIAALAHRNASYSGRIPARLEGRNRDLPRLLTGAPVGAAARPTPSAIRAIRIPPPPRSFASPAR